MSSQFKGLLFLAIVVLSIASCKKDVDIAQDDLSHYIPASSDMVMSMDIGNLIQKADIESIQEMDFFQDFISEVGDENTDLSYILENPRESGIDFSGKIYMHTDINTDDEVPNVGVLVPLRKASDFEKMVSTPEDAEILDKGDYKVLEGSNNGLSWNDDFAYISSNGTTDEELEKIFTGTQETTVADMSYFKDNQGDHDMQMWMNTQEIGEKIYQEQVAAFSMAEIKKSALTDNEVYAYADFNDGEMEAVADYNLSPELMKDLKIMVNDEIETDFSNYIPSEDLSFLTALSVDVKGVNQVLQERGAANAGIETALSEIGIEREDFIKTLKGDGFLAMYLKDGKIPNSLIGMTIGDRESFDKVLGEMVNNNFVQKVEDDFYVIDNINDYGVSSFIIKDDIIFASEKADILTDIKLGNLSDAELVDSEQYQKISNGFMGMMTDIYSTELFNETEGQEVIQEVLMNSNLDKTTYKVKFKDKDKNSLNQMIKFFGEQYLKNK